MLYMPRASTTPNAEFFDRNVPIRLQKALLRSLFESYKETSRYCWRHFQPPQAKDLSGTYRRAKIEDEWSGVAALVPDVVVGVRPYKNYTGSFNEITCGNVKITHSCVLSPDVVPRQAEFRATLASNGQLQMFSPNEPSTAIYLYAILTHGVDSDSPKRSRPAFALFQFPNEACTAYVDEGINLFRRFPDLVADYIEPSQAEAQVKHRRFKKPESA